jgi:hypothetical protein
VGEPGRTFPICRGSSHAPQGVRQDHDTTSGLACENMIVSKDVLDMPLIRQEVTFLQNHFAILNFVEASSLGYQYKSWQTEIQDILRARIHLYKNAREDSFTCGLSLRPSHEPWWS